MRLKFAAIVLLVLTTAVRADWKEPADGVFTDEQLTRYLGAIKDITALYKAAGKAADGQGAMGAMGLWARTNEKYEAILKNHKLTDDEFTWLGGKVTEAWVHAMLQLNWEKKSHPASLEAEKKLRADIENQKARIAEYEKALKEGIRVLNPEEAAAIVEQAKEQEKEIGETIKEMTAQIARMKDDITKKEAEAKAADALAAKPPADVPADERADYIESKKAEATAARQEAKDLQDQLADWDKDLKQQQAFLASAQARQKTPGMPASEEDKAGIKEQNEAGINNARESIKMAEDGLAMVVEVRENSRKQMAEMSKDTPRQNIYLLKKRYNEFCEALGLPNEFAEPGK